MVGSESADGIAIVTTMNALVATDNINTNATQVGLSWIRRYPMMCAAGVVLLLMIVAAIVGPWFMPASFAEPSISQDAQFLPPFTDGHWLGTDLNGRDLLYRIFIGARVSLGIGISGALLSLCVGVSYGLISGYLGGKLDLVMMRILEVFNAIPRLIFVVVLVSMIEGAFRHWTSHQLEESGSFLSTLAMYVPSVRSLPMYAKTLVLVASLGFIEWLTMAKIVRGQVLVLKNMQYVVAARSLGQTHLKILARHFLPNLTGIIVVYLTLTIPAVILDESFLSYLGLGVDPGQASWGTLLSDGATVINPIKSYWWLLVFPAGFLSITLLSLNFLGDGLRDILDPRSAR